MVRQVIWKSNPLMLFATQEIEVPEGAELLTAREQGNRFHIWFKCDPSKPIIVRRITVVSTGYDWVPDNTRYIGSGFLEGSTIVLHAFEHIESNP